MTTNPLITATGVYFRMRACKAGFPLAMLHSAALIVDTGMLSIFVDCLAKTSFDFRSGSQNALTSRSEGNSVSKCITDLPIQVFGSIGITRRFTGQLC